MKLDTPLAQLRYFLQDDLYLLKTDQDTYHTTQPAAPAVETPETPVITEQTPAITFKYSGGNQKRFLVLCNYAHAEFMADAHLTALANTLIRLNYTRQDLAIVNLAQYPAAAWQQLSGFFNPQKLLVLGANALPAGLFELNLNEAAQTNGCQALYTFSFDEMMGQKENTKAFWNQIKTF